MTTTINELGAPPAREMDRQQAGSAVLSADEADVSAVTDALPGRGAKALSLDQGLPQLLYELAVRLPVRVGTSRIGVLGLASTQPGAFRALKLQFMQRRSPEGASVDDDNDLQKPTAYHRKRDEKPMYLEEQVRPEDKFDDIIGRSAT